MNTCSMDTAKTTRSFWALNFTQFQGAFNDNLYRFVIAFYFIGLYATGKDETVNEGVSMQILAASTILFTLPFLLFPGLAGSLADRYSKKNIIIATKMWEVGVMSFGLLAFIMNSPVFIAAMLYMMFMQSAFFSPAKYGILPEMLPESRLSWANGMINMATFVAIIAGQVSAGHMQDMMDKGEFTVHHVSILLIILSCIGLATSFGVKRIPPAAPGLAISFNPWKGMWRNIKIYYADQVLWLVVLGAGFFWFAGAVIQMNVLQYGLSVLHISKGDTTNLLASIMIGIAVGSLAAGYASRGRIELGLIPLGLLGMLITSSILAIPGLSYYVVMGLLFFLGFSAGFFDVPVMATIQQRTPAEMKGGMMAVMSIITSIGVLLGGGVYLLAGTIGLNTYAIFGFTAVLTLATGVYLCWRYPYFMLRSIVWLFVNTIYRVKVTGAANIPEKGGALLVANHTSYMDAPFLAIATDRHLRFIISTEFKKTNWWIRPLAKLVGTISIAPTDAPRDIITSINEARDAIREGYVVCIFAEGQITRSGQMLPFKKGFEKIMKGVDAPIIPACLDRVWGSIFSFSDGKVLWKWPKSIPYTVSLNIGAPMPPKTTAFELWSTIRELGTADWMERKIARPLLHHGFIHIARIHPRWACIADQTMPAMNYFKTLVASILFARKLKKLLGSEQMTGICLPPTVGGALTNLSAQMLGRTAVNMNYTASDENLALAAAQCGMRHVITAHAFLERLPNPITLPGEVIYLEDVKKTITGKDRITALLMAAFCPIFILDWMLGGGRKRSQHDIAAVIFSSGSEGKPKGVPLTHFNIVSNVESALQVFPLIPRDSLVGILPFFHSFGYMCTIWLIVRGGFSVVYHPSPLDAKPIGDLVEKFKCNLLITAPTFLQNFMRKISPEQFRSLRNVVTGAEKLPTRIREAFLEKYGINILEGYGTTECSPAVSLNTPDREGPGYYQVGTKNGTIGQPMPGISVRIIDPETGERLQENQPGMLIVKGPNIMKGYLGLPEKTAEVLHDGWYTTGDIAKIDEEGFITITDRLARFSKIAGEMAPHTNIEDELHRLLGLTDRAMAVTGVPDTQKGERLVVLHTLDDEQLAALIRALGDSELPNLWRPRASAFHRIAEIPVLGTGKLNLRAVRDAALEFEGGKE